MICSMGSYYVAGVSGCVESRRAARCTPCFAWVGAKQRVLCDMAITIPESMYSDSLIYVAAPVTSRGVQKLPGNSLFIRGTGAFYSDFSEALLDASIPVDQVDGIGQRCVE